MVALSEGETCGSSSVVWGVAGSENKRALLAVLSILSDSCVPVVPDLRGNLYLRIDVSYPVMPPPSKLMYENSK